MSKLSDALASKAFVVTSELTPPKGTDLGPLFAKAELLKPYATAINLTESHAARMAMDPVAVGHLLEAVQRGPKQTCLDPQRRGAAHQGRQSRAVLQRRSPTPCPFSR